MNQYKKDIYICTSYKPGRSARFSREDLLTPTRPTENKKGNAYNYHVNFPKNNEPYLAYKITIFQILYLNSLKQYAFLKGVKSFKQIFIKIITSNQIFEVIAKYLAREFNMNECK